MLKFIVRRVLYMIPILFGITLVTFLLFNVAGGNPAARAAGRYATAEQIQILSHQMGLDKPLFWQYLDMCRQMVTFDFGRSWASKQLITTLLADGLGPSLSITGPGFLLSLLISIPLALFLAHKRNTLFDKTVMVTCLALLSISSAVYVLAGQYLLSYQLGWFPISGWDPSWYGRWTYALLPILITLSLTLGGDILFYRTVFLEELFQDYVRTARSKGVSDWRIFLVHILRNAMVPIITLVVLEIPFLITGSLLTESFFGIPGIGGLIFSAIQDADFPVIKAITLISALTYMVLQLVGDVLYAMADPKIRLG